MVEAVAFVIFVSAIFFAIWWSVKNDPEADARKKKTGSAPWRKV